MSRALSRFYGAVGRRLDNRGPDRLHLDSNPYGALGDDLADQVATARENMNRTACCGATGGTIYDPATRRMYLDSCQCKGDK